MIERKPASIPLVYSPDGTIFSKDSEMGRRLLEHPADHWKYSDAFELLQGRLGSGDLVLHSPGKLLQEDVALIHTPEIVSEIFSPTAAFIHDTFQFSSELADTIKDDVMRACRARAASTMLATELAISQGYAVSLSTGYHHASRDTATGFCPMSDMGIAIQKFLDQNPDKDVLIVDLDVHQGQGHARVFMHEPRVRILDIYNQSIYPQDRVAADRINYKAALDSGTGDALYAQTLGTLMSKALGDWKPDLIFYVAGSDIAAGDKLGGFRVSRDGVILRDIFMFHKAVENSIPIVMTLGGGYQAGLGAQIAESVGSICDRVAAIKRGMGASNSTTTLGK